MSTRGAGTRTRGLVSISLALLVLLAGPSPSGAAPKGYVRLSDERSRTHSATVLRPVWVRQAPGADAAKLARLGPSTWHRSPEAALVLGEVVIGRRSWSYVRYPGIGSRRGWVPSGALSSLTLHRTRLVLDRRHLRLSLFRGKRLLFRAPVGVGAAGSPTPAGRYYVRERLGPYRNSNSVYGALAFGLSAYSPYRTDWPGGGQVGVHGTNQPGLIPGRISNGCVRLANAHVLRLGRLLKVGVPVKIR